MAQDPRALAGWMANAFLDSVLELKGEAGAEKVRSQLQNILELSRGTPGAFFENPMFGVEEKSAVMDAVLKRHAVEPELRRFLGLLVELRLVQLLEEISRAYEEGLETGRNEVRARVRTAFPLDEEERSRLAQALGRATGKKVLIEEEADPTLIGGVVAQVGSVVYDVSIRGFLQRLQQEF